MKSILLCMALVVALPACTPNEVMTNLPVVGDVCTVATKTTIDEKVVYSADAVYNIAAQAFLAARDSGAFEKNPALRAKVRGMMIQLYGYTGMIKAAKGTANCDFAAMKKLQADILNLLPRK